MTRSTVLIALTLGFLGGSVLFAMLLRWVYAVASAVIAYRRDRSHAGSPMLIVAAIFLHSAPWALAIAAYLAYNASSAPRAQWWPWVFVGAAIGPLLIGSAGLIAMVRKRGGKAEAIPLTPELVHRYKRRTLWTVSLLFGGAQSIVMWFVLWDGRATSVAFALPVVIVCMAGGYVFALVIWQWKKSQLESREHERRRRASAA